MSRVLITGGAGAIGAAIARRLLADPAYEVRISDGRAAPQWMREGCEIHTGDLRLTAQALAATKGCSHVIHLAAFAGADAADHDAPRGLDFRPHTLIEHESAVHGATVRAAIEREVERFVYVSSAEVYERAGLFPTPEDHLHDCPAPSSARAYSRLTGERFCRAAHDEHGLAFTICRPSSPYGPAETAGADPWTANVAGELIEQALGNGRAPQIGGSGERTITPTHVDDIADGVVAALASPAAINEDFNLAGARELSVDELARVVWQACGGAAQKLALEHALSHDREVARSHPSTEKARELLGWHAQVDLEDGIAATVAALRERAYAAPAPAPLPQ
jgi:UDP-glucose 4-epimerase